ncbi:MAG: NAD(P)-dependent oxidoreductase [Candidatus Omnitrophota bacterium]|nr:NAD(P)-dependent oxidoreductase [Candidatus Omnitrophota bacterium]
MEKDSSRKKVLITGANGFVGKQLITSLTNTNWELISAVRRSRGFEKEIIMDFEDPSFDLTIQSLPRVDAIVHLGAKVVWDNDASQILFRPNVMATAKLIDWAKGINAYFVFASSITVCGVKELHITSKSKPNSDTGYGCSKWLAEEIIKMSGVRHGILRISGIFGREGSTHLEINKAIDGALANVVPVQYGRGEMKRNYIYVKDLAEIIKFCIDHEMEGTNLVAGGSVNTIADMVQTICNIIIPGSKPRYCEGKTGQDQIVEHSMNLPKGRSFKDAVKDILKDAKQTSL